MADGYLETHYAEYEKRKAAWLRKRSRLPSRKPAPSIPPRPDDEAL